MFILLTILDVTPTLYAQQSSHISIEGFEAVCDLTAKASWGNYTTSRQILRGSTNASLEFNVASVRERLNVSIEPDGLFVELAPTPFGYEVQRLSLGHNLKVKEKLKITVKEILTVLDLIIKIPSQGLDSLSVNGKDAVFVEEDGVVRLLTPLVIDAHCPINVIAKGKELYVNITLKRTWEPKVIDLTSNVTATSSVQVSVRPSVVSAVEEVIVPITSLNATKTLEAYEPVQVVVERGKEEKLETKREGTNLSTIQETPPESSIQTQQPIETLLGYLLAFKTLILLAAFASLCFAVISGKPYLGVFSLILFVLYFVLLWYGGGAWF
jgi:hypothetical protein